MTSHRFYELLKTVRSSSILVTGDIVLDKYLGGSIDRISPEAPAPIFEVTGETEVPGGAANVAANTAAMGAKTSIVGVVGKDQAGVSVRAMLGKWGIRTGGVISDPSRPTTIKTRIMAMRQQMMRVDREKRDDISRSVGEKMLAGIEKALKTCDGVIVSDYGKGALPEWLLKKLFAICASAGKQVMVDPKGRDYSRYKGATMITPNKREAALASGVDIATEKDYDKAARRIFKVTGAKRLVITRGEEGMSVYARPGAGVHLPASALEVFDVTGAGDTVIAALGVFLFSGFDLEESARIANTAASIEVGHVGAWPVSKEEILIRLGGDSPGGGKEMSRAQAGDYAKKMRARSKKVVFTNGCFDLLHAGHIKLLKTARSRGDCLIVGLNTDKSIRRLKGKARPVLTEDDRVEILSALHCVSAVVLFNEDTPLGVIKAVKPDILVKGDDYRIKDVVGAEVVARYGGKVELTPLAQGKSTSNLIKTILKNHNR